MFLGWGGYDGQRAHQRCQAAAVAAMGPEGDNGLTVAAQAGPMGGVNHSDHRFPFQ